MPNMHVSIDISPLSSAHSVRGTGIYTRNLTEALKIYQKDLVYSYFTQFQNIPKNSDLIHFPYFSPFFITIPPYLPKPFIVTVHDLIPLDYPDNFPSGLKGKAKWKYQKFRLNNAAAIITDSEASRNSILMHTKLTDKKVHVIYLAASSEYRVIDSVTAIESVKNRYEIPKKFFVYVGDLNWNKNVIGLIKAWRLVQDNAENTVYKLLLVGKAFTDRKLPEARDIDTLIAKSKLTDTVYKTGFIPETDLAAIYSLAKSVVIPSFAEGFGLPCIEAMSCGCPAVVSDTSSLSEISGPSIKINPHNPKSLAEGIQSVIDMTPGMYQNLRDESIKWSKNYTWEKTAAQTVDVYKNVLEKI